MPEPPRRKRFQIHLSTAIVLMFVAGMLIWANVLKVKLNRPDAIRIVYIYGWPFSAGLSVENHEGVLPPSDYYWIMDKGLYIWKAPTYYNVAIALGIMFAAWFFCEWLIRRRAARNGA